MNQISKNNNEVQVVRKNKYVILRKFKTYFPVATVPLKKPIIDIDSFNASAIEKISESLKYHVLCTEYSLSPKGGLRQWLKINFSLLLLLGIPILFFTPLIVYFMGGLETIIGKFASITDFLFKSSLSILGFIIVVIIIGTILSFIFHNFKNINSSIKRNSNKNNIDEADWHEV